MYLLLWIFFVYAFLGWCTEVSFAALTSGRFVNRGFLNGPVCPIYGVGVVIVLFFLEPLRSNTFLLFLGSVLLTSLLEWLTGFVLEKIFHQRWWDYSGYFLNLNGRICAEGLLVFGLGGLAIVYVLAPILDNQVRRIPGKALVPVSLALAAVFVGDLAYSSVHPNEGKGITDYQKAETEEEGETEDAVLSCAHGRDHYRYLSGRLS